jgi:hypothetical protein
LKGIMAWSEYHFSAAGRIGPVRQKRNSESGPGAAATGLPAAPWPGEKW